MKLNVIGEHLNGLKVLQPGAFQDDRGFFLESWREDYFAELGLPIHFPQDNHSGSVQGVVRGLHYQWDQPMDKLMRVTRGSAYLMAVDIRDGSPTLGQWFGIEASADNRIQVYAPAGFARGFCALSEFVEIQYKCTAIYNPSAESGILWNDPALGIVWPQQAWAHLGEPILSGKDRNAQTLEQWLARPESKHFDISQEASWRP
jgi:dTDP-4-dehydrorhamnose 3,5-epimerase